MRIKDADNMYSPLNKKPVALIYSKREIVFDMRSHGWIQVSRYCDLGLKMLP